MVSVQVFYSDLPGQNPTFEPRGRCADWEHAVALVRRQRGFTAAQPRAIPSHDRDVVTLVYSAAGGTYKLEGPRPGPHQ